MPTTQPLDEDELGDIAEGPLKPIAAFSAPAAQPDAPTPVPAQGAHNANAPQPVPTAIGTGVAAPIQSAQTAPATRFRPKGISTPGISLSGKSTFNKVPETAQNNPTHTEAPRQVLNTPYTESDVVKAWKAFIETYAAEHVLVNAMRASTPKLMGEDTFRIAQSSVHLDYISEHLVRITDFVHNFVHNSNIVFTLEEVSEDSPLVWCERELLEHMKESNPGLSDFITDLNLKLL